MSLESKQTYDVLPSDHDLVAHYKPKYLARGGDHLVYEVDNHPDVIIKASTFIIKDILCDNEKYKLPLDTFSGDLKKELEDEISQKNIQIRQLRKYFGNGHTLSERRYLTKVPITKEILDEIFKNDWKKRVTPEGSEDLKEVWSAVIVQQRAEAINDPNHLGLYFGTFLEERGFDLSEYQTLNKLLIQNDIQFEGDINLFLSLQDNPKTHALKDVLEKTSEDNELKDKLVELINKIILYANETGNILALAGEDNLILYPENNDWNYLLLDVLPIHNEPVFSCSKEIISKLLKGEKISDHEKTLLMKSLNFTRTINGLALSLKIPERLNLISSENRGQNIDFYTLLHI